MPHITRRACLSPCTRCYISRRRARHETRHRAHHRGTRRRRLALPLKMKQLRQISINKKALPRSWLLRTFALEVIIIEQCHGPHLHRGNRPRRHGLVRRVLLRVVRRGRVVHLQETFQTSEILQLKSAVRAFY